MALALGFAAGSLLSARLWISTRFYPLTPVSAKLPAIPFPIDYILFLALFVLLTAVILFPGPRALLFAFVAITVALGLFDQTRWQPWVFQYLFMLAALGFFSWKSSDSKGQDRALNTCRFIVTSIYFWSGLQKINADFMGGVFPWMIEPIARLLPESVKPFPRSLGIAAPFVEAGIGVGLLTRKCRNVAVVLAIAMHVFILSTIGPLGHNWNSVVWPWNVAMAVFVLLLFWQAKDLSLREVLWTKGFAFQKVVLVLFGVMPLFSFFNLWDSYLSSALYSGNTSAAVIYVNDEVKNRLPGYAQNHASEVSTNTHALDIGGWSFGELNVPPFPEPRIYKSIAKSICRYASDPSGVALVIQEKPALFNGGRQSVYDCSNL